MKLVEFAVVSTRIFFKMNDSAAKRAYHVWYRRSCMEMSTSELFEHNSCKSKSSPETRRVTVTKVGTKSPAHARARVQLSDNAPPGGLPRQFAY